VTDRARPEVQVDREETDGSQNERNEHRPGFRKLALPTRLIPRLQWR
jgi:hypothetical protein